MHACVRACCRCCYKRAIYALQSIVISVRACLITESNLRAYQTTSPSPSEYHPALCNSDTENIYVGFTHPLDILYEIRCHESLSFPITDPFPSSNYLLNSLLLFHLLPPSPLSPSPASHTHHSPFPLAHHTPHPKQTSAHPSHPHVRVPSSAPHPHTGGGALTPNQKPYLVGPAIIAGWLPLRRESGTLGLVEREWIRYGRGDELRERDKGRGKREKVVREVEFSFSRWKTGA